jgi:hypothetical protein
MIYSPQSPPNHKWSVKVLQKGAIKVTFALSYSHFESGRVSLNC